MADLVATAMLAAAGRTFLRAALSAQTRANDGITIGEKNGVRYISRTPESVLAERDAELWAECAADMQAMLMEPDPQ